MTDIDIKAIRVAADRAAHGLEHTDQIHWRVLVGPNEVIALCDEVERLRSTVNEFHHAIKDAGWHPGRTDDLLTDIIRAKGVEVERLRTALKLIEWSNDLSLQTQVATEALKGKPE